MKAGQRYRSRPIVVFASLLFTLTQTSAAQPRTNQAPELMPNVDATFWEVGFDNREFSIRIVGEGSDGQVYGFLQKVGGWQVVRWDGVLLESLGTAFHRPVDLILDPDGHHIVAEAGNRARIDQWDGKYWQRVAWFPSDKTLKAIAVDKTGQIYAGYDKVEGFGGGVIRWTGSGWEEIGTTPFGYTNVLTFGADGSLYIGGSFTLFGTAFADNIVKWDGSTWSDLDQGVSNDVLDIAAAPDSSILVAGRFISVAADYSVLSRGVARWDGSAWHSLNKGTDPLGWVSRVVVRSDGMVFASGLFEGIGQSSAKSIARWDGSHWYSLGDDTRVGSFAAMSDGRVFGGGDFELIFGYPYQGIAVWDGSSWDPVGTLGSGVNGTVTKLAVGIDGDVFAAGEFTRAGRLPVNHIARWDGSNWHKLGEGIDGWVTSMVVSDDGNLIVGGSFDLASVPNARNVVRWDGKAWRSLGLGSDLSVKQLALTVDGLLVAGLSGHVGGTLVSEVRLWDGAEWSPLGGRFEGRINDVATGPGGEVYIVGSGAHIVSRWDGSTWQQMDNGVDQFAHAVAVDGDGIPYISARTVLNGNARILRWDGAAWIVISTYSSYRLAVGPDGALFASPRTGLRRFDGNNWFVVPGAPELINAIAFQDDQTLFVGGRFREAGGVQSDNIAVWKGAILYSSPLPRQPADDALDVPTTVSLQWDEMVGSDWYEVQVAGDPSFSSPIFQANVPQTHLEFVAPVAGVRYYWQVRSFGNDRYSKWSESRSFQVGTSGPLAVTLQRPPDRATKVRKPIDFEWAGAPDADSYHFQLSKNQSFTSLVRNAEGLTSTTRRVSDIAGATTYFWRVAGVDDHGQKTFSQTRSFTTILDAPAVATLIAPADGAIRVSRSPTFAWQSLSTADTYQLQVATDLAFTGIVVNDSALAVTSRTVTHPLDFGTTYFWRVRGRNAGGNGVWSDARSFTTIVAAPGAVTLIEPDDGMNHTSIRPVFRWVGSSSALYYQLQVATDVGFAAIVANDSALTETSRTLSEHLDFETAYFWRVRGRNAGGNGTWSEIRSFTTIVAAPDAVTLLQPTNGAKGISISPVLKWAGPQSALLHQLQIATDSLMANLVVNDSALADQEDSLETSLQNSSEYFWRARARNAGGNGPWSEIWSFRTEVATPPPVTLTSPEDGAAGVPPYAALSWQSVQDVLGYHVQLGSDSTFNILIFDDSLFAESTMDLVEPLPYNTMFFWHIRAGRDDGLAKTMGVLYGPWSKTASFTVAVGTAVVDAASAPTEYLLHPVYPNPFNPSTTIAFDLPQPVQVRMVVFDAVGRFVESLLDGHHPAGRHTVVWDAGDVPSGMYFVRLEAASYKKSIRMLLVK